MSLRDELALIANSLQSLSSGTEAASHLRSLISSLLEAEERAVQRGYARGLVHGRAEGHKEGFDRNRDKTAVRREKLQALVIVVTGIALAVWVVVRML
jgi:hypothetical protein